MTERTGALIFGGGLIGSAAALYLGRIGMPVTVITRAPPPQGLDRVKWEFGSIADTRSETDFITCGAVVYAAGSMTPGSQFTSIAQVLSDQVVPVVTLAERAARAGVPNFVFISSGGTVYGSTTIIPTNEDVCTAPINAYGMVKVQTEQALLEVGRRSAMRVIILRVSNPYGPAQQGTRSIGFVAAAIEAAQRQTSLQIWGDGHNQRDFIYLDDVASAVHQAVHFQGTSETLNIGSSRSTSLLEVCQMIERLSRRKIDIAFDASRQVDVRRNVLDNTKAANVLKWQPTVSLENGISTILKLKGMM